MHGGSYLSYALTAVDAKLRVSVPPAFREIVVANTVDRTLWIGPSETDDCLIGFDTRFEQKLQTQIEARFAGDFGPARAAAIRDTFGSAYQLKIDDAHRITLTKTLSGVLEAPKLIYFLGAGEYFELWNPHKLLASPGCNPRVARILRAELDVRGEAA